MAGGCGDKGGSTHTPSSAAMSTSTPSNAASTPLPSGPTMPAAAKGLTVSSADAFARFYLDALYHLQLTGDAAPMLQWAESGCIACKNLISYYKKTYAAGGSLTGDFKLRQVRVTAARLVNAHAADVRVSALGGRHTYVPKRGGKPTIYPGGATTWRFALAARDGQWIMYEMEQS
jgi:hypothetical protein